MKKMIAVFIMVLVASALFASPIQLGTFPIGQWLDHNYDAVWDFSSSNIRILSTDGRVLYDFSSRTIENFRIFLEGIQPGIGFSCPEAGRTYSFVTTPPSSNVRMEIERPGLPKYVVDMRRQ